MLFCMQMRTSPLQLHPHPSPTLPCLTASGTREGAPQFRCEVHGPMGHLSEKIHQCGGQTAGVRVGVQPRNCASNAMRMSKEQCDPPGRLSKYLYNDQLG